MAEVLLGEDGVDTSAPLITALLTTPGKADTIVSRPRLLDLIDTAARSPVTIISGEAAAGKTSVVVEWTNSRATGRPIAWMTVRPALVDPVMFWRYLLAAAGQLGVGCDDLELALADTVVPNERWLIALANRLSAVPDEPVIVIDDLQELRSPEAMESLLAFLEMTQASLHVLLLTRAKPPWQLARWRVSGRLSEIDSADLRFSREEARALVNAAELDLSDADLAVLLDRTEGWAGGMRLAMLSLRRSADPGAFVARFAADDELVSSYLFREVLDRQTPDLREFLLDISIFDSCTHEICDALREQDDSWELLERCRAESLFVTRYHSGAYHLHPLFAQLLRARLNLQDHGRLLTLHRRASAILEEVGDIGAGITHAVAADDVKRASELVTRHAGEFAQRGRFDEVRSWLALLPDDATLEAPEVVISLAMTLSICGDFDDAHAQLDQLDGQEVSPRLRYAGSQARLVAHALNGDVETMAEAAEILDREVPSGDVVLPFEPVRMALCYQGIAAFLAGDLRRARVSLEQATERRVDPNVQYVEAPGWLARVEHADGNLADGERHAHQCLARNDRLGGSQTAVVTPAYLALADIAWERNQLDKADVLLDKARRSVRPLLWYAVLVQISTSRVLASRGRLDEARQQLVECGQTYLQSDSSPQLRALLSETAVELALMAGDADDARRWVRTYDGCADRRLPVSVQLRLSEHIGTENIVAIVEDAVATKQSVPQEIDSLLAGAALVGRVGDARRCGELVSLATHLAEPSGLIRRFVDSGVEVHGALQDLATTESAAEGTPVAGQLFLQTLNAAVDDDTAGAPRRTPPPGELVEPLSRREVQVLGLLARELTYAEIGAELYVSRNTVKSHASHIYTKLGVSGRAEATAEGQRLGIV